MIRDDYTQDPAEPYHVDADEADPRDVAEGMATVAFKQAVNDLLDGGRNSNFLNELVDDVLAARCRARIPTPRIDGGDPAEWDDTDPDAKPASPSAPPPF
jgi:hypothetical protein